MRYIIKRCKYGELGRDEEGFRLHKNGTRIPVLLSMSLLTDGNNNATGIVTHATDITERKVVEEELMATQDAVKASETKYRLIHATAFDAIIVADIDGSIVERNASANKIFGYEGDELLDRSFFELLDEEYRGVLIEEISRLSITGNVKNQENIIEMCGLHKDGKVFPIEMSLSSFELRGTPLDYTAVNVSYDNCN